MALTRVKAFSGRNTTFASSVTTSSVTVTAGNLIVAVVEADVVAQNGVTVTDSKGNTWNRVLSTAVVDTFDLEIWYSVITTGGAGYTVTATDNGGGVDSLIICEEWSGQDSVPLDRSTSANGSSTNLNSGATSATTVNDEVVICGGVISGNTTMTAGAGFSNLTKVNTTFSTLAFESEIVATTGAQTGTITAGATGVWICGVATFKQAAAGVVVSSGIKMTTNTRFMG